MSETRSDRFQIVACKVADHAFAFPISVVREIIRATAPRSVGSSIPGALGVVELRGTAMPVCDLATAMDLPATDLTGDLSGHRIVVTVLEDGSSPVGWLVTGVDEVLVVDAGSVETLHAGRSRFVSMVAHTGDGRLLPIIELEAFGSAVAA